MSGFLLDTNVISASSPIRTDKNDHFVRWLKSQAKLETLFLSVVTVHEISRGISLLRNKGATAKADTLSLWLDIVRSDFTDRLLGVDETTATVAGELEAAALSAGLGTGMADALIAATARVNGLTLVTNNIRHFQMFGIDVQSPADLSV